MHALTASSRVQWREYDHLIPKVKKSVYRCFIHLSSQHYANTTFNTIPNKQNVINRLDLRAKLA